MPRHLIRFAAHFPQRRRNGSFVLYSDWLFPDATNPYKSLCRRSFISTIVSGIIMISKSLVTIIVLAILSLLVSCFQPFYFAHGQQMSFTISRHQLFHRRRKQQWRLASSSSDFVANRSDLASVFLVSLSGENESRICWGIPYHALKCNFQIWKTSTAFRAIFRLLAHFKITTGTVLLPKRPITWLAS